MMRRFRIILFLLGLICSPSVSIAQKYSIIGTVKDQNNGKPISGAVVSIKNIHSTTDAEGNFCIISTFGNHQLNCKALGYKPIQYEIKLFSNQELKINLVKLSDIVNKRIYDKIIEEDSTLNIKNGYTIATNKIKDIPTIFSDNDLLKSLQFVPGISKGKSGNVYTSVRGCNSYQTNYFIDGVPIYNIQHASGYISNFNDMDYSQVALMKSSIAPEYGGRAGAIIEFQTQQSNTKKFSGTFQTTLPALALNINGPLGKKITYSISYRRSYIDILLKPFFNDSFDLKYHFSDFNGNIKYHINNKNLITLNWINNADIYDAETKSTEGLSSGNALETKRSQSTDIKGKTTWLKWEQRYQYGKRTLTLMKSVNDLNDHLKEQQNELNGIGSNNLSLKDLINTKGFQYQGFRYHIIHNTYQTQFQMGLQFMNETYETGNQKYYQTSGSITLNDTTFRFMPVTKQSWLAVYGNMHKILKKNKEINLGLRLTYLKNSSSQIVIEPRISYTQILSKNWHFKASFDRMAQLNHSLQTTSAGILISDWWLPTTDTYKPQINDQISVQLNKKINNKWSFEGNAYYIFMEYVSMTKTAYQAVNNHDFNWMNRLQTGTGQSYGIEAIFHKTIGLTRGWLSYCQTWSYRKLDGYYNNQYFRYNLDRKADLTICLIHSYTRRCNIGTTIVFTGGLPYSVPVSKYLLPIGSSIYPTWQGQQVLVYYGRNTNNFNMFKRIDFSLNLEGKSMNGRKSQSFIFTLYNALNSFNPESLRYTYNTGSKQFFFIASQSFPILPTIGYQFKF